MLNYNTNILKWIEVISKFYAFIMISIFSNSVTEPDYEEDRFNI